MRPLTLGTFRARFRDQRIERCGHGGMSADAVRQGNELAVDYHCRHGLHVVFLRQHHRPLHLAVDAKDGGFDNLGPFESLLAAQSKNALS